MGPEEAIRLVRVHIDTRGFANYPVDQLDAWEDAKGWEVAPRTDPTDLSTLRIGGTVFLVTPDSIVHEGSGSLPPHSTWDHVSTG